MLHRFIELTPLRLWILFSISMHMVAGHFLLNSEKVNPEFTIKQNEFSIEANFISIQPAQTKPVAQAQNQQLEVLNSELGLIEETMNLGNVIAEESIAQVDSKPTEDILEKIEQIQEEISQRQESKMTEVAEVLQDKEILKETSVLEDIKDVIKELTESILSPELSGVSEYIPPSIIANPEPKYPHKAKIAGHEGTVRLKVKINDIGMPEFVDVIESSGYEELDTRAQSTVLSKWKFKAAERKGERTSSELTMSLHFKLNKKSLSKKVA